MNKKYYFLLGLSAMLCLGSVSLSAASVVDVQSKVSEAQQNHAQVQQQIDALDEATRQQNSEYLALLTELRIIKLSNARYTKQLLAQTNELQGLQGQLRSVAQIDMEIEPLMQQVFEALKAFVAADLPFMASQRQQDLLQLETQLSTAQLSLSEKYQALLQAYAKESGYGEAIESYQGLAAINDEKKQVNFFRLGRVAYYYQTLDKQQSGRWSPTLNKWESLDRAENDALLNAITMSKGISVPSLVALPFSSALLKEVN